MKKSLKLEKLFTLSHKVTVYVPSTMDINKEIDNAEYVDEVATLLSSLFGGATSSQAIGYWNSPTAGLVKEKTVIVFAFAESLEKIDLVIDKCEELKEKLNQDAIALEIDGQMYFI